MKKKLSKFGNSRALIIDKPILKLLNINDDTVLEIKIVDNSLLIAPVKKNKDQVVSKNEKVQKAYEEITEEYADDFKKMSKK